MNKGIPVELSCCFILFQSITGQQLVPRSGISPPFISGLVKTNIFIHALAAPGQVGPLVMSGDASLRRGRCEARLLAIHLHDINFNGLWEVQPCAGRPLTGATTEANIL